MTDLLTRDFKQANPDFLYFLKKPIWSKLKAVQNKQVYNVNWNVGGSIPLQISSKNILKPCKGQHELRLDGIYASLWRVQSRILILAFNYF